MIIRERLTFWETRFKAVVARYQYAPFVWGETDCACWACDVAEALTGFDALAPYRGRYKSRAEIRALIRANGFNNWRDAGHHEFIAAGWQVLDDIRAARVGDLAAVSSSAFGVRLPGGFAVRQSQGLAIIKPEWVSTAWGIG